MAKKYSSRRTFLRSLGALGTTLPFFRLLDTSVAEAQAPAPLRLLLMSSPHGMTPEYWKPQGGETDFNITYANSPLAPLEPFRSKIFIPTGVDLRVLYEKGADTGHTCGPCALFTGTEAIKKNDDVYPTGPSLDQALAAQFGSATRFPSLQLGVLAQAGYSAFDSFHFGPGGTRLPGQDDPAEVHARLFGNAAAPAPDQSNRKKAMYAALKDDINRLNKRLAGPEKEKLDAHLSALDDLERRIVTAAAAPTTCSTPAQPPALDPLDPKLIPEIATAQMGLLAQAFACDLTRIASLQFLYAGNANPMPWIGLNVNMHDDVAHRVGDADSYRLQLAKSNLWYATQLATFMGLLDAIKEGNGTVLDNTIIVWANELGNPAAHNNMDHPWVIAGGAGGKFRMGRSVNYGDNELVDSVDTAKFKSMAAHNGILTSVAQAFGMQQGSFGDPDYAGPLPNLA